MDAHTFDRLVAAAACRPTRRTTLRLLTGGLLGALLPARCARAQEPTCTAVGAACSSNTCCQADPNYTFVQCCFDANGAGICTDVAASGTFHCPDPGVPTSGCPAGQADCGGFCTDLLTDHGNCGACGTRCSQLGEGYSCVNGSCVFYCLPGLVDCGGTCVDLASDEFHCGACFNPCPLGGYCEGGVCGGLICQEPLVDCYGRCVDLDVDWQNCGACGVGCFEGAKCVGGTCFEEIGLLG